MVRQRDPRPEGGAPVGASDPARSGADGAKAAFLSLVGHELKTPLNTILGQADLLLQDALPDHARQAVEAIREAGQGLFALVGDLLDISRQDGTARDESADLDIRAVAASLSRLAGGEAASRGLELEIAIDPAVPARLKGDAARIRQALMKLIDNALKFTERGGVSVSIMMADAGDALSCQVADTGVGIDPADQERIFAAFEQGESLLTRSRGGLGIGLALTAQLVRAMGGEIGLDSRPGIGATFWFTAPVAMPAEGPPQAGAPLDDEHVDDAVMRRLQGLPVLAADDNPLHRAALARMFAACQMDAEIVSNGYEAVEAAGRRNFAFILLDAHMPIVSGIQAARMIHALSQRQQGTHVMIGCAAGDPVEAEAQAISDSVLRKPYSSRAVFAAFIAALQGDKAATGGFDAAAISDLELSVGRGVLVDILRSYMVAAEAMTRRIEAALPQDDALELEQAARDLASAAGGLGLAALTSAAQELSQEARAGGMSRSLSAQAERLVALSETTRDQLAALYPDLAASA